MSTSDFPVSAAALTSAEIPSTEPLDQDDQELPLPSQGFMRRREAQDQPLERLIQLLAKLPGLGPRSARRAALALLKKRDALLRPLIETLGTTDRTIVSCERCGNLDTSNPCAVCASPRRDPGLICVVEDVEDLWAMERSRAFQGHYHVLGGVLSALSGMTPERLRIGALLERARAGTSTEGGAITEIILALGATVEGQTTGHYLAEQLSATGIKVTRLAQGLPVGGEIDYLDDGTLIAALRARRPL